MNPKIDAAIAAARAGGQVALRYFRTDLTIESKPDRSPVTAADRESEQRIVEVLKARFPDYGFCGEEFGEQAGRGGARWIIDPIDGTKSFVRGIPFFAALIALEEDGRVTVGVIHAPATGELLYAARGEGAFDEAGQRLRVSSVDRLSRAMVSFGGFAVFRERGYWPAFEALVTRSIRQRGFGDYLGSAMVARGWCEAMLELDVKPWDLAPLKVIVEEAGGRFTDFEGNATIYGGSAVVTNGKIHDEVLEILHDCRESRL